MAKSLSYDGITSRSHKSAGGEKARRLHKVIITIIISVVILSVSFAVFGLNPAFALPVKPVHHSTAWNYIIPIWLNKTVYIAIDNPVSSAGFIPSLTMITFSNLDSGYFLEMVFINGTHLNLTLGIFGHNNIPLYVSIPNGVSIDIRSVYVSVVFIHVLGNSTYSVTSWTSWATRPRATGIEL